MNLVPKTTRVEVVERARWQLVSVPGQIRRKLYGWIEAVTVHGLEFVKRISGYHDEPLKGRRFGQRSIRLNRAYRAIYEVIENKEIQIVRIEEVTKHEY